MLVAAITQHPLLIGRENKLKKATPVKKIALILFITLVMPVLSEAVARYAFERNIKLTLLKFSDISINKKDRPQSAAFKGFDELNDCSRKESWLDAEYTPTPYENIYKKYSIISQYRPYINHYMGSNEFPKESNCKKVFVFGGSTVAGDGIPCSKGLITSYLQDILNQNAQGCYSVYNYGSSGFNQGNELALFVELLKAEKIPDIAVFYDGSNDATHKVAMSVPLMGYSRYVLAGQPSKGIFARFAGFVVDHSALLTYLIHGRHRDKYHIAMDENGVPYRTYPFDGEFLSDASIEKRAVRTAKEFVRSLALMQRLSEAYGVKVIFVLQPTIFTTSPLSEEESALLEKTNQKAPYLATAHDKLNKHILKEVSSSDRDLSFLDATSALHGKARSVFIDYVHVSPVGNEMLAKVLADKIQGLSE